MTTYDRMQALAHRATHEQTIAAAVALGWGQDGDYAVDGVHVKFVDVAQASPRDVLSGKGMGASEYIRRYMRQEFEREHGYGSSVRWRQLGASTGAQAATEELLCGRIADAYAAAGVEMTPPTAAERAFAACGGSFASI